MGTETALWLLPTAPLGVGSGVTRRQHRWQGRAIGKPPCMLRVLLFSTAAAYCSQGRWVQSRHCRDPDPPAGWAKAMTACSAWGSGPAQAGLHGATLIPHRGAEAAAQLWQQQPRHRGSNGSGNSFWLLPALSLRGPPSCLQTEYQGRKTMGPSPCPVFTHAQPEMLSTFEVLCSSNSIPVHNCSWRGSNEQNSPAEIAWLIYRGRM